MTPLVSVLSAVHNEEAYIDEMIASLQKQTHTAWEAVFVSDGSTDQTTGLIERAMETDRRIRLTGSGERIGKVAAFNQAFASSEGKLVVLLAGDDTLPPSSLATRVRALAELQLNGRRAVAFFKLRTMSAESKLDGLVLPRGRASSHSGGTVTMTRCLAEIVFPIESRLVSEDLWVSRACEGVASEVVERPEVVLNYRIHAGNSNPRRRPFDEMTDQIARRHDAWRALLDCDRLTLAPRVREEVEALWTAELLRRLGRTGRLLTLQQLSVRDRAAFISMANPAAYWLRSRFYKLLSGRRGR